MFQQNKLKVAVIGSGVSGLVSAYTLQKKSMGLVQVSLIEAGAYFGGHAHTVDVHLDGKNFGVDTGFLVYNERTYPGLIALLDELGVKRAKSDMGFSVHALASSTTRELMWSGNNLNTVFAQRRHLLRPKFLGMLKDMLRFNRLCTQIAERGDEKQLRQSVGDFLCEQRLGRAFIEDYFLPMIGCIWSCPTEQMLAFPMSTMIRFCHNHGLLQITQRPQWWTIEGGSRQYVTQILKHIDDARLNTPVHSIRRLPDGVELETNMGHEYYDAVICATHSDQALRLLGTDATDAERSVLGAIAYQSNRAVLHTDTLQMPRLKKVWSAWNYERDAAADAGRGHVCLHYWLNALQPLPTEQPIFVSLNPLREIDTAKVMASFEYEHPVFDEAAIAAQTRLPNIQGAADAHGRTWFAGAWTCYGFHEDGLQSGLSAAEDVLHKLERLSVPAGQVA